MRVAGVVTAVISLLTAVCGPASAVAGESAGGSVGQSAGAAVVPAPSWAVDGPSSGATRGGHGKSRRIVRDGEPVTSGLEVTIDQVVPASIEPGEPLQISGTVTNLDPRRWKDLQVFLVVDPIAITSREQLDAALESPADTYNGDRICTTGCSADKGQYDEAGALAPGESTTYALTVPFSLLGLEGTAPGVHTVSVHVLGERVDQGRLEGADGRARILMPYLSDAQDAVGVCVVIPLHHELQRLEDGTYDDLDELIRSISPGGLLRNRLDLVAATKDGQASLTVDPALIDVLRAIVDDDLGPPSPDTGGNDEEQEDEAGDEPTDDQQAAAEFLDRLELAATRSDVLIEPYGQADLQALVGRPELRLTRTVRQVGARALSDTQITGDPVLQPVGELDTQALAPLARERVIVVSSEQVRGWAIADGPTARVVDDGATAVPVVVADASLQAGGLAPGPSDSTLHVRQRVLAEAAMLSLAGARTGLVFRPDDEWDPGPGAAGDELFDQLDTPWVFATNLSSVADARRGAPVRPAPVLEAPAPLPASVLTAAARLRRHSTTFDTVTGRDAPLRSYYQQLAVLAVSSQLRADPATAQGLADAATATIDQQLSRISVQGPEFVTLSSSSGPFPITLTNRLDRPVTVGAVIYDEERLLKVVEVEPQTIAPRTAVTVTVSVEAPSVGVTTVRVRLATENGRAFGEPVTFPLRSSMVGTVIWYAMGGIGVLLLVLVVRRIARRLRPGPGTAGTAP